MFSCGNGNKLGIVFMEKERMSKPKTTWQYNSRSMNVYIAAQFVILM